MNVKAMLGVLAIGGSIVLSSAYQGAKALPSIDPNLVMVSSEKAAKVAPQRRSQVKHRQWRHRGGRHPFYGSRH
jgi:hypothetical protein